MPSHMAVGMGSLVPLNVNYVAIKQYSGYYYRRMFYLTIIGIVLMCLILIGNKAYYHDYSRKKNVIDNICDIKNMRYNQYVESASGSREIIYGIYVMDDMNQKANFMKSIYKLRDAIL